jgi:hypothetical protein
VFGVISINKPIMMMIIIDHTGAKIKLNKEVYERVCKIASTNMKRKYMIKAINTYAIPVLTYSFGVIKWSICDIQGAERCVAS